MRKGKRWWAGWVIHRRLDIKTDWSGVLWFLKGFELIKLVSCRWWIMHPNFYFSIMFLLVAGTGPPWITGTGQWRGLVEMEWPVWAMECVYDRTVQYLVNWTCDPYKSYPRCVWSSPSDRMVPSFTHKVPCDTCLPGYIKGCLWTDNFQERWNCHISKIYYFLMLWKRFSTEVWNSYLV